MVECTTAKATATQPQPHSHSHILSLSQSHGCTQLHPHTATTRTVIHGDVEGHVILACQRIEQLLLCALVLVQQPVHTVHARRVVPLVERQQLGAVWAVGIRPVVIVIVVIIIIIIVIIVVLTTSVSLCLHCDASASIVATRDIAAASSVGIATTIAITTTARVSIAIFTSGGGIRGSHISLGGRWRWFRRCIGLVSAHLCLGLRCWLSCWRWLRRWR